MATNFSDLHGLWEKAIVKKPERVLQISGLPILNASKRTDLNIDEI